MNLVNYSIRLDEEVRNKLQSLSKEKGITVGKLIDYALMVFEQQERNNAIGIEVNKLEERLKAINEAMQEKEKGIEMFK